MKIVLEGTAEEIENLMTLIEEAESVRSGGRKGKDKLPTVRKDYQTENLWCVEDVTTKYDCDSKKALLILERALMNDATMEQIWFAIDHHAEDYGVDIHEENKS
jgi:hypothetical protein